MFKKALIASLLTTSSFSSSAEWLRGISFTDFSGDINIRGNSDLDLGAVVGFMGYKARINRKFYIVPSVRLGLGISEDKVKVWGRELDVNLESFVALSLRNQIQLNRQVYVFLSPSYSKVELTVDEGRSYSITEESDWELGGGGGFGFNIDRKTSLEVSYEQYDGTDVISVGFKSSF